MTKHAHLVRSALPAIAAALALGPTPLLAQEIQAPPPVAAGPAAPVVVAPGAAASAAPQVVVPPPIRQTPTPRQPTQLENRPVVQQVPPTPVVEPVESATRQAGTSAAPAPARPGASAESSTPARAAAQSETTTNTAPVTNTAPATESGTGPLLSPSTQGSRAQDISSTPARPAIVPVAEDDGLPAELQILAGLTALGLLIGAIALFRRRRVEPASLTPAIERPVVAERPAEPVVAAEQQPLVESPAPRVQRIAEPIPWGAGLPHAGAAVALPREAPASQEEREALIQRMVAARPDRANPFRTPRARAKRARLILQSLGRTFDREPGIDLSQYPHNWPELARRDYPQVA